MPFPPPVLVRRSRIQGRGVFAARHIVEGERIIEYTGALLSHAEADALCEDESARRHHTFLFAVDDRCVIDGANGGNDSRFINHSCDPNCESVIVGRRVYIHALRSIESGEELLYDYWYVTDVAFIRAAAERRTAGARSRGRPAAASVQFDARRPRSVETNVCAS